MGSDDQSIITRLNTAFTGQAAIFGFVNAEPTLKPAGPIELTPQESETAKILRDSVTAVFEPVTPYGILRSHPSSWEIEPRIEYLSTDYAEVSAKRQTANKFRGPQPEVLSACVVLFSRSNRCVYLNRRSKNVVTYKDCLHTYGGHFIPNPLWGISDSNRLVRTAVRQLWEEASVDISGDLSCPLMMSKELPTGFVQLVLLGIDVPAIGHHESEVEGKAEIVLFSDLPSKLVSDRWVPSGLMHVLAWLGLGAPGTEDSDWTTALPRAIFEVATNLPQLQLVFEKPYISHDPMGVEIVLRQRDQDPKSYWTVGRTDCPFPMSHHRGWARLQALVRSPGVAIPPINLVKWPQGRQPTADEHDVAPGKSSLEGARTDVINALREVRERLVKLNVPGQEWRKCLLERAAVEWKKAERATSGRSLKELLLTSFVTLISELRREQYPDVADIFACEATNITAQPLKYWESQAKLRGESFGQIHPAFYYAPVMLERMIFKTVTTRDSPIYMYDSSNPILWETEPER